MASIFTYPLLDQWGETLEGGGDAGKDTGAQIAASWGDDVPITPSASVFWASEAKAFDRVGDNTEAARITGDEADIFPYLRMHNFGFAMPTTGLVKGVEVEIGYQMDLLGVAAKWDEDELFIAWGASAALGRTTDKFIGATAAASARRTFGGPTDLWGESSGTITPTIVNGTDFGCIAKWARNDTGDETIEIDYIQMRVYYEDTVDGTIRTTQTYAEVLGTIAQPANVSQNYAEVLAALGPSPPVIFPRVIIVT
jgi:hypothetical protein